MQLVQTDSGISKVRQSHLTCCRGSVMLVQTCLRWRVRKRNNCFRFTPTIVQLVTFCGVSRYELSPAFVSHEYFTLPPRLTTGETVHCEESC